MSSMPDLLRQYALINPLASQRVGLGMISARFCSSHPSPYCSLSIAKKFWRDWAELIKLIVRYNLWLVFSSRSGGSMGRVCAALTIFRKWLSSARISLIHCASAAEAEFHHSFAWRLLYTTQWQRVR